MKNASNDNVSLSTFCNLTIFFAGLDAAKADELASYKGWWAQFMTDPEDDKELLNVELGNKMVLLMDILKESYLIGDKVGYKPDHSRILGDLLGLFYNIMP